MSDDCPVKTSPPSLAGAQLSPRGVRALIFPDLHLCAETKNSHGTSTATTTTTQESRASSSYTTPNTSSRASSAEPTTESSTEPPSSSVVWAPPCSPIRIPARLRRKCPMYPQFDGKQEDYGDIVASSAAEKNLGTTKIEPVSEGEDDDALPPTAGTSSVAVASPSEPKTERVVRRKRIVPPVPVPHLIKKSRGRRVPEPDEARERTHICSVPGCSKSFARAEHLKRHVISLHTHEKPFVCGCGKTFARRDNLLQHQRVHAT